MRKYKKLDFCVISKIALIYLVISDLCRNKNVGIGNDTEQFLSIKNTCSS